MHFVAQKGILVFPHFFYNQIELERYNLMGQQHSQQSASPNCPQIFRCWQSEDHQSTPYKERAQEYFLYDIDIKDLLISNKERSKWMEEHTTIHPFQHSLIQQGKKQEKKTAEMTSVQERRESKAESQLLLPEFSCKKQLFHNKNDSYRLGSVDTHEETIRNMAIDFCKQNENTTNTNFNSYQMKKINRESNVFIELSNQQSPKRHSKSLSISSDFLTPFENNVHAQTPCSEKWQKYLNSMNRNKFQRSINHNSIQQYSSQGRNSSQIICFMNANYIGSVQDNIPNGLGEFRYNNGDIQYGFFQDNLCQGKGKYVKSDGTVYDGDFVNGQACGFGVYISSDGYRYEGSWKANLPDGLGKVIYRDGSVYEGDLVQGKRHGRGRFVQNSCIYEGEFRCDKIEGMAILTSQGGQTYKGEWKEDQFDGHGEYTWPNGDHYVGNYKRGRRSGYGVMNYENGDTYAGNWRNGMKDGQGTFTSNNTVKTGWWVRSQYVESLMSQ